QQVGRDPTLRLLGLRRPNAEGGGDGNCGGSGEGGTAQAGHWAASSSRRRPARAGGSIGIRSIALYQSISRAVRHITAIPTAFTSSCIASPELYSERTKWPSAESRMLRQKISSDWRPHASTGRVAGQDRKPALTGT